MLHNVSIGGIRSVVMIDGGADMNCASAGWMHKNMEYLLPFLKTDLDPCFTVDGTTAKTTGKMISGVRVKIGEYEEDLDFKVINIGASYDIILSAQWLATNRVLLDYDPESEERVVIR